ncbi:hypothetical protein [uncultured Tateyamaria sp.]|uniref:hypothetical protein n=1 Tax=uncultured Tateyamaria sp. TaxID=455651 RepID=UPI0026060F3E|nr:hypothetical protein [uncultured Tateyamaria sp.]
MSVEAALSLTFSIMPFDVAMTTYRTHPAGRARIFALLHDDSAARNTTRQVGPATDHQASPRVAHTLQ